MCACVVGCCVGREVPEEEGGGSGQGIPQMEEFSQREIRKTREKLFRGREGGRGGGGVIRWERCVYTYTYCLSETGRFQA